MNSDSNAVYWSVRRELWENRYLYVVPLAAAGIALFASSVGAAFSLWLQYQALYVLEQTCPWCLTSAICMQLLAGLTITRLLRLPSLPGEDAL